MEVVEASREVIRKPASADTRWRYSVTPFAPLSTTVAAFGIPGYVSYGTAKAALIGMTMNLAVAGAPHGIRANAVLPNATTRMALAAGTRHQIETALDTLWRLLEPPADRRAQFKFVFREPFNDALAFLKPHLKTQPVAVDESLIKRVPVGRERSEKGADKGQGAGQRNRKS